MPAPISVQRSGLSDRKSTPTNRAKTIRGVSKRRDESGIAPPGGFDNGQVGHNSDDHRSRQKAPFGQIGRDKPLLVDQAKQQTRRDQREHGM